MSFHSNVICGKRSPKRSSTSSGSPGYQKRSVISSADSESLLLRSRPSFLSFSFSLSLSLSAFVSPPLDVSEQATNNMTLKTNPKIERMRFPFICLINPLDIILANIQIFLCFLYYDTYYALLYQIILEGK